MVFQELLVLALHLIALKAGQLIEAELKDGVGLGLAEAVLPLVVEAGFAAQEDAEFLDPLLA